MSDMDVFPPAGRVALAIGAAAIAAAIAGAALFESLAVTIFPFALIISSLHAILIGAPAYYSLRKSRPLTYEIAALAGAIIGAVPIGLIVSLDAGRIELDSAFLFIGAVGAFGGLVFRGVLGSEPARLERAGW